MNDVHMSDMSDEDSTPPSSEDEAKKKIKKSKYATKKDPEPKMKIGSIRAGKLAREMKALEERHHNDGTGCPIDHHVVRGIKDATRRNTQQKAGSQEEEERQDADLLKVTRKKVHQDEDDKANPQSSSPSAYKAPAPRTPKTIHTTDYMD